MLLQGLRHGGERREQLGERLRVGLEQGILAGHRIQGHLAVVGVDDCLHRVANVVDPSEVILRHHAADPLRVGVLVGGGVTVDDVHDAAVDDDGIRVGVEREERRNCLDSLAHIALEDDPRVALDEGGDERIDAAEAQRERATPDERAHRDARRLAVACLAEVGRGRLTRSRVDTDLVAIGVDDRVAAEVLAEVNLRTIDREVELGIDLRRKPADQEVGEAALDLVGGREDHAVAVRIGEVRVLPALDVVLVELAHADDHLRLFAVDRVTIEIGHAELVEVLYALQRGQRGRDANRRDEPGVREVFGGGLHLGGGGLGVVRELLLLDVVDAIGRARRGDVALDVDAFFGRLRRLDAEPLHECRVDVARGNRAERPQADRDRR